MKYQSFQRILNKIFLSVILLVSLTNTVIQAQQTNAQIMERAQETYTWNNREPDERYKADILLVVAHADDETMRSAYLARAIDQKRRVAIVWLNSTGQSINGGVNNSGREQSMALAAIREIEGVRAALSLGIGNFWCLGSSDTNSQNPLESLEGNDHGHLLGRLVRLVRLTRPSVILTFLPVFVTGENHSDHQAAGVLATEAFDLAGDPTAFPEQIAPAREPGLYMNRTEDLLPWQPEKLYYFTNATHSDFYAGQGPEYSTTDISPTRHVSYGTIAREAASSHVTQFSSRARSAPPANTRARESAPSQFILGKSLVASGITDDVFAGVVPAGIPYERPPGYIAAKHAEPLMELGDPWHYYRLLWQAHGLDRLNGLVPPEVSLTAGGTLSIPLIVDNPLGPAQK